jgi:hypothetical protein
MYKEKKKKKQKEKAKRKSKKMCPFGEKRKLTVKRLTNDSHICYSLFQYHRLFFAYHMGWENKRKRKKEEKNVSILCLRRNRINFNKSVLIRVGSFNTTLALSRARVYTLMRLRKSLVFALVRTWDETRGMCCF